MLGLQRSPSTVSDQQMEALQHRVRGHTLNLQRKNISEMNDGALIKKDTRSVHTTRNYPINNMMDSALIEQSAHIFVKFFLVCTLHD